MRFAPPGNLPSVFDAVKRSFIALVALALLAPLMVLTASRADAALPETAEDTWQTNGTVNVILPIGDTIYIGGDFSELHDGAGSSVPRNNLAAIDRLTGTPTSFNPNMNNKVYGMSQSPDGTKLYVVGSFTKVDVTTTRKRLAEFDIATGALTSFKPPFPNKTVRTVASDGTTLYIGGAFDKVGGILRKRLAAYDLATETLDPTWTPNANAVVKSMVADPGKIWVGGNFSRINGIFAKGLAAVNVVDGTLLATDHPTFPVLDIAPLGDQLFLAGSGPGGRAAAFDRTTGTQQWAATANGNVQGVAALGNFAYFGGHHTKLNGTTVGQLTRLDITTGALDTSWLPNVNGLKGVNDVAAAGLSVYIGGDFTFVSSEPHESFAMFVDDLQPYTADLSVTATVTPTTPVVGSALTYDANITNNGPQTAPEAVVTVALSPFVAFTSADAGCSYTAIDHTVTCELGLIASGEDIDVSIDVQASQDGTAVSTFTTSSEAIDPVPANDSVDVSVDIGSVPGTADVGVQLAASADPIGVSSLLDYTVTITNTGPESASAVQLLDPLPPEVTAQAVTTTAGTCTLAATIDCDLGTVTLGQIVTVQITVLTPATPATLTNTATVSTASFDPDPTDDSAVEYTTVSDGNPGDMTAPQLVSATMLDIDENGYVDTIEVTFDEALAPCSAPCTAGWSLTAVPSGGSLSSVSTSGTVATLQLTEGPGDPATAVGGLMVELGEPNSIQDAAGNHSTFAPTAPLDGAAPVPTTFRKSNSGTGGFAELGDTLSTEWSELILGSSLPTTTDVVITDPVSGNDQLTIPGFLDGDMDMGSDDFLECTYNLSIVTGCQDPPFQVVFAGSAIGLAGGGDVITVTLAACTGDCDLLAVGPKSNVIYVSSPDITDLAGNAATGTFPKFFKLF